jgi:cytochrome c biogenesis protein CcmG, thiol:disulfide interchange protein DsbE
MNNLISQLQRYRFAPRLSRYWLQCLIIAMLLASCSASLPPPPTATLPANVASASQSLVSGRGLPVVGEVAPDFSYTMANGTTARLSDFRGKVVIINFWATWCIPCRKEMPALQQAADQSNGQVVVIGINKGEAAETIAAFAQEVMVQFTLVANPASDIAERYGIRNLPTSYFIRPDGTIGDWRLGEMNATMIEESIAKSR